MVSSEKLLDVKDGLAMGEIENVCVAVWRDGVTYARFERQRKALTEIVQRHPGEAAFLCVVEPTSNPPDDELREASAKMLVDQGQNLVCVALVIEGTGVRTAIVRTVLATIGMIWFRRKAVVEYVATVRSGVEWLSARVSIPSIDNFIKSVEDLRSRLGPPEKKLKTKSINSSRPTVY
jgi:hypothetical protein